MLLNVTFISNLNCHAVITNFMYLDVWTLGPVPVLIIS